MYHFYFVIFYYLLPLQFFPKIYCHQCRIYKVSLSMSQNHAVLPADLVYVSDTCQKEILSKSTRLDSSAWKQFREEGWGFWSYWKLENFWNISRVCCKGHLPLSLHQILFLHCIWTNLSDAHNILEAWIINFRCFTLFTSTDVNNDFDRLMGFFILYRKWALGLASLYNIHFVLKKWHLYTSEEISNLQLF